MRRIREAGHQVVFDDDGCNIINAKAGWVTPIDMGKVHLQFWGICEANAISPGGDEIFKCNRVPAIIISITSIIVIAFMCGCSINLFRCVFTPHRARMN